MSNYNIEHITDVATDGVSRLFDEYINKLNDEEFEIWVDYHLKNCERKELQGYCNHMLYIGKKQ